MQMIRNSVRSRWRVPGVAVAAGLVMLGAQWSSGHLDRGLASLAIMVAFAAALVAFSGRSAVFEVMRDPTTDERTTMLDLQATAFAGVVLILVVLGAFVYDTAQSGDGSPYTWLAAVAGVSHMAALALLHRRS